jgi:hypothetical protein
MLGNYRVAAQLLASHAVLISTELVMTVFWKKKIPTVVLPFWKDSLLVSANYNGGYIVGCDAKHEQYSTRLYGIITQKREILYLFSLPCYDRIQNILSA